MDKWRCVKTDPIPRDGKPLLICAHRGGKPVAGEAEWHSEYDYDGSGWWWANTYGDYHAEELISDGWIITHWQPMPHPVPPQEPTHE